MPQKNHISKNMINVVLISGLLLSSVGISSLPVDTLADYRIPKTENENNLSLKKNTNLVSLIKEKDPQKLIVKKLTDFEGKKISVQENITNIFDLNNNNVTIKNKEKGDIKINYPKIIENTQVEIVEDKIIHSGENSKTDIVVESVDGGVRHVININSSLSPKTYDFNLELQQNEEIIINDNGSAFIQKSQDGKKSKPVVKLMIGKPWALDKNNKELKTWYTVVGSSTLRQHIDFTDAEFPIIADPIWCGNAVSSVSWIYRAGLWSASNNMTGCGAWNCSGQYGCWQESESKTFFCAQFSGNTCVTIPWNKNSTSQTNSMIDQFYCHADFPKGTKNPWNLEPARPDKGYWAFVSTACN